jgi:excisionase family DNA binding protein
VKVRIKHVNNQHHEGEGKLEQPLVTAAQVAKKLNVTVQTVYRYAKTGALPHYGFGGAIRFSEEDVAKFLKAAKK